MQTITVVTYAAGFNSSEDRYVYKTQPAVGVHVVHLRALVHG